MDCFVQRWTNLLSLVMCLFFAEVSKVFIKIKPSTISVHTGVTCGEPSLDNVATKAKFLLLKRWCNSSLLNCVVPADTDTSARCLKVMLYNKFIGL
jgi:hypothetical protein